MNQPVKKLFFFLAIAVLVAGGYLLWQSMQDQGPGSGFVGGNGRIEATEIDIAAKLAGRLEEVLVEEGDFVALGQPLARMQTNVLEAQLNEAKAQLQQAISVEVSAKAQIAVRESDRAAAEAVVAQRTSELDGANRRLVRSTNLSKTGAMTKQEFDDNETAMHGARAAVSSAKAQVAVAQASIEAAQAQHKGTLASIEAAKASITRIEADIKDSLLIATRAGRIQYRIAQPGEVLAAGGKVMNLVDLADVYMTFFLPEVAAGRVALGSEVRLVLDAAPTYVIPAKISFVSSTAQFTPKTVETASERQKLMFRVKAQVSPELLRKYSEWVKTGLPGMAWIKLDPNAAWPENLSKVLQ